MDDNDGWDGDRLWAWVTLTDDGYWSQVGAYSPEQRLHVSLTFMSKRTALKMRHFAEQHRRVTGQRVALREYRLAGTIEELF